MVPNLYVQYGTVQYDSTAIMDRLVDPGACAHVRLSANKEPFIILYCCRRRQTPLRFRRRTLPASSSLISTIEYFRFPFHRRWKSSPQSPQPPLPPPPSQRHLRNFRKRNALLVARKNEEARTAVLLEAEAEARLSPNELRALQRRQKVDEAMVR